MRTLKPGPTVVKFLPVLLIMHRFRSGAAHPSGAFIFCRCIWDGIGIPSGRGKGEAEMRESLYSFCMRTGKTELLDEWDEEKNGSLTPEGVTSGSSRRVWWRCP